MKLKLKTATLVAMVTSALYALIIVINTLQYVSLKFYDFLSSIESLVNLAFPIGLSIFFYSLYQNQKG